MDGFDCNQFMRLRTLPGTNSTQQPGVYRFNTVSIQLRCK